MIRMPKTSASMPKKRQSTDIKMKLSVIFDPEPEQWAFRGDPYFWRHLRKRVSRTGLPVDPDSLERFIRKEHYRLTGIRLTSGSIGIAEELAHGGMTSGGISGKFWTMYAIPLLRERLAAANAKVSNAAVGDRINTGCRDDAASGSAEADT